MAAMRATSGFQRGTLVFGLVLVLFFIVLAVFASWIAPYGFDQAGVGAKTFPTQAAPSAQHWFGTTVDGYDVLSRVIFGAQTALEVIVLAVLLAIVVGVPLGLLSGYFGGWIDRVAVSRRRLAVRVPDAAARDRRRGGDQRRQQRKVVVDHRDGRVDHGRVHAAVLPGRPQCDGRSA